MRRINEIVANLKDSNLKILNGDIIVSGGTGFIGKWIVRVLIEMKSNKLINGNIILVVRDKKATRIQFGIYEEYIDFVNLQELEDDNFILQYPNIGYVIHAAMPRKNRFEIDDHDYYQIIRLTENLLHIAKQSMQVPSFLHLSSGAVYGLQIRQKNFIDENSEISRSTANDRYAELKIEIEKQVQESSVMGDVRGSNPRLFTLYGEGLPLDQGYAIGNFVRDAIEKGSISVTGNPLTTRSYLYITDLIEWIIKVMVSPTLSNLHFGASSPITMSQLAEAIASQYQIDKINYKGENIEANHYVPRNETTLTKLGLIERTNLQAGLQDWLPSIEIGQNP